MVFIYEDDQWRNLLPLVHLRPVFDLRCGRRTLLEKYQALYAHEEFGLLVRAELEALAAEQHPELQVNSSPTPDPRPPTPMLFLSGRAILDKPLPVHGPEEVFTNGREIIGFRVNPARFRTFRSSQSGVRSSLVRSWHLPERKVLASVVKFPWNLIEFNEPELVQELRDAAEQTQKGRRKDAEDAFCERSDSASEAVLRAKRFCGFVVVGDPRNLRIARGAQIDPGVVFDLRLGRILIDEQAQVRSRSVVAGPCYVGKDTVLDAALIRPGCSFGPGCRIGGEVEASIFLGRANKHHEGFIGHAIVGEWVNLGAMTTNSDLRNDYGEVKVMLWSKEPRNQGTKEPRKELRNTMLRKFGCIIADHAKTAIGSLLNTGAVLGVFANWFEPGLSPKAVPDFGRGSRGVGKLDELIDTARIVMSRRGVRLSLDYEQLVRRIYRRGSQNAFYFT